MNNTMQESERAKIRDIKSKVIAMLEERHAIESGDTTVSDDATVASPSRYWSDFCSYFDYMMGLPEEYFAKLRLHTYHLTADNYLTYYFVEPEYFKGDTALETVLEALTKDLPGNYILNEPEGGIGFRLGEDRFVSTDIVRYQRVVSVLYRHNILSMLSSTDGQRPYILEIGGGYGGLAHHLSDIVGTSTYIIVDLPETLLFSASYLSLLNPEKKIYLYDRSEFPDLIESEPLDSYDFVLLPNYKLHSLANLRFDLVINVASLQEMRTSQVETYLDFIRDTCKGVFYSWNQDGQIRNKELSNLSDLLRQRFELNQIREKEPAIATYTQMTIPLSSASKKTVTEGKLKPKLRRVARETAILVGLLERTPDTPFHDVLHKQSYKEYICRPLPPRQDIEQ